MNRKRVQRLYRGERLTVRRRGGRKRAFGTPAPIETPLAANQRWSLDFVSDQLTDGRRFRVLAVIDNCTRECLAQTETYLLGSSRITRALLPGAARRMSRCTNKEGVRGKASA